MYQLRKNLADSVVIYGRGRELFRPPTYLVEKQFRTFFPFVILPYRTPFALKGVIFALLISSLLSPFPVH